MGKAPRRVYVCTRCLKAGKVRRPSERHLLVEHRSRPSRAGEEPLGEVDGRAVVTDTNLLRFRVAVAGALAHLESRREEVNDLNVFPVADGDTGDNMALTLRAVLDELDRLQGADEGRTIDEIGREEIVQSVARAALLGARGNSGVILSQLIRGAAEELVSRPGQLIDATLIGAALAKGADRAYASVRDPAEGTILTVAREMAHKIVTDVAHTPENARLRPGTEQREQDGAIAETLERAIVAGQDSVKRGPELLAALREAGVVDAGGYGLTIILAGVVAALRGDEPPELDHHAPARISHPEHSSSTYRFCTNFAVTGSGLSPGRFIEPLEAAGRLGARRRRRHDAQGAPAHRRARAAPRRCSPTPGRSRGWTWPTCARSSPSATSACSAARPSPARTAHRSRSPPRSMERTAPPRWRASSRSRPSTAPSACAAARSRWSAGRALPRCTASSACTRSTAVRRSTPRPMTCWRASTRCRPRRWWCSPTAPNVIMAAERAAELSDKQVLVAPTPSQQAGLAAAVALAPDRSVEENARALSEALARVRTGAVAQAARDDAQGRFRRGEAVGFVEERGARLGRARRDARGGAATSWRRARTDRPRRS